MTFHRENGNLVNTGQPVVNPNEHKIRHQGFHYLKKSFLQNNFSSLVKHLSVSIALQSKHRTHAECQALSKTFTRNRSSIGFPQAAHVIIMLKPMLFLSHTLKTSTNFQNSQLPT